MSAKTDDKLNGAEVRVHDMTRSAPERDFLLSALAVFRQDQEQAQKVIATLLPPSVPEYAEVQQLRLNAEARTHFLQEFQMLTSAQVADLLGSKAKNRNALAHKLARQRRLFSVNLRRNDLYPSFQFDADGPLPAMARILAALDQAGLSGWEIALWFDTENDLLDDRRPVDLILAEPDAVVAAAAAEADIPE